MSRARGIHQAQLAADGIAAATAKAEREQRRQEEALQRQRETEELARQQEEQRQRQEQLRRQREEQQRRKEEEQRQQQQEQDWHAANKAALLQRQRLLTPTVVHTVANEAGVTPWTMDEGDFELAMGVSVVANSNPVAVICPVASRITPEVADRLIAITIYVASEYERRNIARQCKPGQKIIVMPVAPQ